MGERGDVRARSFPFELENEMWCGNGEGWEGSGVEAKEGDTEAQKYSTAGISTAGA